jgi:hypothetical protein
LTVYSVSKNWYGHLGEPKILCVDLDHLSKSTNIDLNLKPSPFSLSPLTFSPSHRTLQPLFLSFCALCLIPHYILPVLILHKKCMMFKHDLSLIDNKHLRTHLLFHLSPRIQYTIVISAILHLDSKSFDKRVPN